MSTENGDTAKIVASRAARQGKDASKNLSRAASAASQNGAEVVEDVAKRTGVAFGELGQGFIGLSASIALATWAVKRFNQAWSQRP